MAPKLYYVEPSPPARAVLMVAATLEVKLDLVEVDLLNREHMKPEFLQKNPEHTVPVYEDENFILCDSHAIVTYLVTAYGKDDSLYPKDPKKRAIIDSRLHYDSSTLFNRYKNIVRPVLFLGETSISWQKLDDIVEAYGFGEAFLGKSQWMGGDQVTIADYCCITSVISMDIIVPVDAEKFPKLTAWMKKCSSLPQYREMCLPGHESLRQLLEANLPKH